MKKSTNSPPKIYLKDRWRRRLSVLLTLVLALGLFPAKHASASVTVPTSAGTGFTITATTNAVTTEVGKDASFNFPITVTLGSPVVAIGSSTVIAREVQVRMVVSATGWSPAASSWQSLTVAANGMSATGNIVHNFGSIQTTMLGSSLSAQIQVRVRTQSSQRWAMSFDSTSFSYCGGTTYYSTDSSQTSPRVNGYGVDISCSVYNRREIRSDCGNSCGVPMSCVVEDHSGCDEYECNPSYNCSCPWTYQTGTAVVQSTSSWSAYTADTAHQTSTFHLGNIVAAGSGGGGVDLPTWLQNSPTPITFPNTPTQLPPHLLNSPTPITFPNTPTQLPPHLLNSPTPITFPNTPTQLPPHLLNSPTPITFPNTPTQLPPHLLNSPTPITFVPTATPLPDHLLTPKMARNANG